MSEILEFLNGMSDASEAAEVHTFDVYISNYSVRVEVSDYGPQAGNLRYMVYAFSPDIAKEDRMINTRGESLGNPDANLRMALMNVHWNVFQNRTDD